MRKRLCEGGYRARVPGKKTKLSERNKQQRLLWGNNNVRKIKNAWRKVLFSDESTIVLQHDSNQYVRRASGERYNEDCILHKINRSVAHVNVYGAFDHNGSTELIRINGRMNALNYAQIIRTNLLPLRNTLLPPGSVYMHDNLPIHTANSIRELLQEHHIPVLPWPACSLDMNPIEHVWVHLKRSYSCLNVHNKDTLFLELHTCWRQFMGNHLLRHNLIDTMPHRLQALVRAQGHSTKY